MVCIRSSWSEYWRSHPLRFWDKCARIGLLLSPTRDIGGLGEKVGFDLEHAIGDGETHFCHEAVVAGSNESDMVGFFEESVPFVMGFLVIRSVFDQCADGASRDRDGVEDGERLLRGFAWVVLLGFEDLGYLGTHELDLQIDFLARVVDEHLALFSGVVFPIDAGGWVVGRFFWMEGRVFNRCGHGYCSFALNSLVISQDSYPGIDDARMMLARLRMEGRVDGVWGGHGYCSFALESREGAHTGAPLRMNVSSYDL